MEILVVDDERQLSELLVDYLGRCGWNATPASSATEALKLLRGRNFDLVISDISMPGASGLELLREVGSFWPGTRVILITGSATADSTLEALQNGALAILKKPFSLQEVRNKIHEAFVTVAPPMDAQGPGAGSSAQGEGLHCLGSKSLEILAAIPAALALVDSQGMVLDFNEAFIRTFAGQGRQVRGSHLCIGLGCPLTSSRACSDPCEVWERLQQAAVEGHSSGPFVCSIPLNQATAGQRVLFQTRILVLPGGDGTAPQQRNLAVLMEDVSEFLDAEAGLLDSGCMGCLGDITRDIAHELAQPLNAISAQCQLLKLRIEQHDEPSKEMVISCLEELQRQTNRMIELLNHLRFSSLNQTLGRQRSPEPRVSSIYL
jgi:CheY-like chemotaxis protein